MASFISSARPSPIVEDVAEDQSSNTSTFVGSPDPSPHQSSSTVIFGATVSSNEGIPLTPPNVRYQLPAPSIAGTPSTPFYDPRGQDEWFITWLTNPQGIGFPSELLNKLIGAFGPQNVSTFISLGDCDPRILRHYLGTNTFNAFYRELCIIQYLKVYALHKTDVHEDPTNLYRRFDLEYYRRIVFGVGRTFVVQLQEFIRESQSPSSNVTMTPGGFGPLSSQSNASINPQSTSGIGNVGSIQQPTNQGVTFGPETPFPTNYTAAFTQFSPISYGSNPSNLPTVTPSSFSSSSRFHRFDQQDVSELTQASRSDRNTAAYTGFSENLLPITIPRFQLPFRNLLHTKNPNRYLLCRKILLFWPKICPKCQTLLSDSQICPLRPKICALPDSFLFSPLCHVKNQANLL